MKHTEAELRELDAWIAEHVFGDKPEPGKCVPFSSEQYCHPHYSSQLGHAMEVLKKCLDKSAVELWKRVDRPGYSCSNNNLEESSAWDATAETLELAICLFAKKLFSK